MTVAPGQEAPDFELTSQDREKVRLSSFRGEKPVVLVFFPFAATSVCEGELCQLRDDIADFEAAGAQLLAISCDSQPTQKLWADKNGWNFPVLSDFWPHGQVARRYGAFDEARGCPTRATFVIDRDGRVADTFSSPGLRTPRERGRYEEALARL
jgi:peroxiredoxin